MLGYLVMTPLVRIRGPGLCRGEAVEYLRVCVFCDGGGEEIGEGRFECSLVLGVQAASR